MGLHEDLLVDLIGSIYEAAMLPSRWPQVLEAVSDHLAGAAILTGIQRLPEGIPSAMFARLDPRAVHAFQRDFGRAAGNMAGRMIGQEPGTLAIREELIDQGTYHRSPLYGDLFRHYDIDEFVLATLVRNSEYMVPFWVSRPTGHGGFSREQLELLRRLVPHLQRAMQIQHQLETAAAETAGLADTLDRLSVAVLLLDAGGMVTRTNSAAERLLRANDGLAVRNGCLTTANPKETEQLGRLIDIAATTGMRRGTNPAGTMAVSRPTCGMPLSLLVAPLPARAVTAWGHGATAVVFVREPGAARNVTGTLLAQLYGLTGAEAQVAMVLLDGASPPEVAARLGIGLATVRSHLHSLFAKTGTRRQAELTGLLAGLSLP